MRLHQKCSQKKVIQLWNLNLFLKYSLNQTLICVTSHNWEVHKQIIVPQKQCPWQPTAFTLSQPSSDTTEQTVPMCAERLVNTRYNPDILSALELACPVTRRGPLEGGDLLTKQLFPIWRPYCHIYVHNPWSYLEDDVISLKLRTLVSGCLCVFSYLSSDRLRFPTQALILFCASRWVMESVAIPSMESTMSPTLILALAAFPPSVSYTSKHTDNRRVSGNKKTQQKWVKCWFWFATHHSVP